MTSGVRVAAGDPVLDRLARIGTATLSMQLIKKGLRTTWMDGPQRLIGEGAIAAPAYTLRFVPGRENLATPESYGDPGALPAAIDAAPEGTLVVIDSQRLIGSGTVGDIFADRLRLKGVKGIISDGSVRDIAGLRAVGLPIWAPGTAAPPSIYGLSFVGAGEPIGCGGAAVWPGDIVVADDDGALVIPPGLCAEIAELGEAQNAFEQYVQARVAKGEQLVGLYPPSEATRAAYESSRTAGRAPAQQQDGGARTEKP